MLVFCKHHPDMQHYFKRHYKAKGYVYRGFIHAHNGFYMVFYHPKKNPTKPT